MAEDQPIEGALERVVVNERGAHAQAEGGLAEPEVGELVRAVGGAASCSFRWHGLGRRRGAAGEGVCDGAAHLHAEGAHTVASERGEPAERGPEGGPGREKTDCAQMFTV